MKLLEGMIGRGIAVDVPSCCGIIGDSDTLIALERSIVELSEAFSDPSMGSFEEFIDHQVQLTRDTMHSRGGTSLGRGLSSVKPSAGWAHTPPAAAHTMIEHASRLLGVDREVIHEADPEVDRLMIAMTPYLRSQFVFQPENKGKAQTAPVRVALDRLPGLICGVRIIARLAALAGMRPVTFQTVARLLKTHGPVVWCIAHAADPMVWWQGAMEVPGPSRSRPFLTSWVRVMRELLPSRQGTAKRLLVDILCEHCRWEGAERIAFLTFVGGHVASLTSPVSQPADFQRINGRIRLQARLQRWAFGVLSDRVLDEVLSRLPDQVLGKDRNRS